MINGDQKSFLGIIYALNEIAGTHGYGRIDMIENRLVGVKSRECYEVPAGLALIQAHKALEDLVLEREVLHYKLGMEQAWATAVYNGQWFSPLKEAIDAFMASTQRCLSGTVKPKFYKGSCTVVGRKSAYSLYDYALATYDKDDSFDRTAAKGFIELHGLSTKTWAKNRRQEGAPAELFDAEKQEGLAHEGQVRGRHALGKSVSRKPNPSWRRTGWAARESREGGQPPARREGPGRCGQEPDAPKRSDRKETHGTLVRQVHRERERVHAALRRVAAG